MRRAGRGGASLTFLFLSPGSRERRGPAILSLLPLFLHFSHSHTQSTGTAEVDTACILIVRDWAGRVGTGRGERG